MITQLRSVNYKQIAGYALANSILTFATSEKIMIDNKFSLSVGYKSNSPQPVINKRTLLDEGYSFPAQILKYARVL
jgi:hypothetical protein